MAQFIKNRWLKIILRTSGVFIALLFLALMALQVPYVQTKIVHSVADYLTKKTGFPTTVNEISIYWFDRMHAKGLKINDPDGFPMIHASDALLDFELSALWQSNEKVVDYVEIDSAKVYARVTFFKDSSKNLNLTEYFNRLQQLNSIEANRKPSFIFDEVVLTNSVFLYHDTQKGKPVIDFNYNNFEIDEIDAHVFDFNIHSDTIEMQVQSLKGHVNKHDLPIKNFKGQFRYSKKALEFNGIEAQIGKSIIKDTVVLAYESPDDLQEFSTNVQMTGHFKRSKIHSEDLKLFVPSFKNIKDIFELTGTFNGRVNNLQLKDAELAFGKSTILKGEIRMEGLPNVEETFMNYNLHDSYVLVQDLTPYLKTSTIERMKALHHFNFDGRLIGFVNDFVAHGEFNTDMGKIISDINLKLRTEINESEYSGKLALIDFDLKEYSQNPLVGKVTLNGTIKGKGLSVETADFILEGKVNSFDFKDYRYKNITTEGHFKNRFFEGDLIINDPNASVNLTGAIDFRNKVEKFHFTSTIHELNLQPLKLSKRDISIKGETAIYAQGLAIDSITGEGIVSNALISVDDQSLSIDSLYFLSTQIDQFRNISLSSDLVDVKVQGIFTPNHTYKELKNLTKEYLLTLENNDDKIKSHYNLKNALTYDNYNLDVDIDVKEINSFLKLFQDSLHISENTKFKGSIEGGYISDIALEVQSDSIRVDKIALQNTKFSAFLLKAADSIYFSGKVKAESYQQQFGKNIYTHNLYLNSDWKNNTIDYQLNLEQPDFGNHAFLSGNVHFLKNKILLNFLNSDIDIFNNKWRLPLNSKIIFSEDQVAFEDVQLSHKNQLISINGKLNRSSNESLELVVDSVNLSHFNPLLLKPVYGFLSGRIHFLDIYDDFKVNVIASVQNFEVEDFKVGDIAATTFYNDFHKKSDIAVVIRKSNKTIGSVQGTYEHKKKINQLDLNAKLKNAPLYILEPFFDEYFTSVQGTATGDIRITGTPLKPVLKGTGMINEGGLTVSYLNTYYDFSGPFSADSTNIHFHNLQITDEENNVGNLGGRISHNFFHNWSLDISGNVNNFLVLNTTSKDNSLFYGTGYGTGSISFKGDVNNLTISAKAKTEPGTRIFIPLSESNEIETQEFINFVNLNDSISQKVNVSSEEVDLTGITLDLALDVTTDAYSEIIFDIKSGDIIRGRGEGDLLLTMDPTGEFNMFGDLYIQEGGYNFTLYNIVNKEFQISPNSRISWYGDPYEGQMDIQASYEQLASLRPIIPEAAEVEDVPMEVKRPYRSKVMMDLNGPLLVPNIDFNIVVEDLPNYAVEVNDTPIEMNLLFSRFKDSWDEQELNRQVFSLIVLRRFSPLQSFNTGGSIASSVSELLSNQLSYWMTQVDENLEIDVNLGSLDEEAFNTFQLRLSYTMFDGRLRIIRDGGFTNPYDNKQTGVQEAIGDWTVEYLLTPDGKLRVKMYNRTNYGLDQAQTQNGVLTTGFSILHTQSFDEIKDLFKKTRENSRNQQSNEKALNNEGKSEEDEIL